MDLETAVRGDIPILVVVKNNSGHKRQDTSDAGRSACVRAFEGGDFCAGRKHWARGRVERKNRRLCAAFSEAMDAVRHGIGAG
jgi:thiamine pyrophosphate-dependent acetolactate synthase large subunit-like protein